MLGLEIDPDRVAAALPHATASVTFARGGFEIPSAERPVLVRAMNVLRQYEESEVPAAWARVTERLAPGGLLVDGTCDELGRIASWVDVAAEGPVRLTVSLPDGAGAEGEFVRVPPGGSASTDVRVVNVGTDGGPLAGRCTTVPVVAIAIDAPNYDRYEQVPVRIRGCIETDVSMLSVSVLRGGS